MGGRFQLEQGHTAAEVAQLIMDAANATAINSTAIDATAIG